MQYGLETPRLKYHLKRVVENARTKDFQIQTVRMVMANQPNIVMIDKNRRKLLWWKQQHEMIVKSKRRNTRN